MKKTNTMVAFFTNREPVRSKNLEHHQVAPNEYLERPQASFKTLGLVALGTDRTSLLHLLLTGNQTEQPCLSPIPLEIFEPRSAKTFAELARLSEMGELEADLRQFQKFESGICHPGSFLEARVSGPCTALVAYGYTVTGPFFEKIVVKVDPAGAGPNGPTHYRGVLLIVSGLDGEREELVCEAPDPRTCSDILAARAASLGGRLR